MLHVIYSHFCTYNSKIEAILQSDSMQVNDKEGVGQPQVTKGQFSELASSNTNVCF